MKDLKLEEVLSIMRLFTTQTELTPKWNSKQPEWMFEPYFSNGYICATNGAVGIFIDPSRFIWDVPVVLDKRDKGFPRLPEFLPKEKRRALGVDWVTENVSDVNDCGYWTINVGDGQYYEEFWRPIKAALFLFGGNELTMLTEATEEDPLVMEIMDGVMVVIMPYKDDEQEATE